MTNTPDTDPWTVRDFTQAMNTTRVGRQPTQAERDTAEQNSHANRINQEVREVMNRPAPVSPADKLYGHLTSLPGRQEQQQAFRDRMDAQRGR